MPKWPTIADVIAQMVATNAIHAEDHKTALLLDEDVTPIPEQLGMPHILALLAAEHATPSSRFTKAFRNSCISLAMGYEVAQQGERIQHACERPASWGRRDQVNSPHGYGH